MISVVSSKGIYHQHTLFPSTTNTITTAFLLFPFTTTTTNTFLLSSLRYYQHISIVFLHHHEHHIFIVFPPVPHFYHLPSTCTTTGNQGSVIVPLSYLYDPSMYGGRNVISCLLTYVLYCVVCIEGEFEPIIPKIRLSIKDKNN